MKKVTVRGALRFSNPEKLGEGLDAFERLAYPGSFTRDLWRLKGEVAQCDTSFEIESDCDHRPAFVAMAQQALDGCVDFRVAGIEDSFERLKSNRRFVKDWLITRLDATVQSRGQDGKVRAVHSFGDEVDALRSTWLPKDAEKRSPAKSRAVPAKQVKGALKKAGKRTSR